MFDLVPDALACLVALALVFYLPGWALTGRGSGTIPATFARMLASTIATTIVATFLAAAGRFSLANLLVCLAALAIVAWPLARAGAGAARPAAARDRGGPFVFALALLAFWPGYPSFLGASDSTTYLGSGVALVRNGTLALEDPLGPQVPLPVRTQIFDSMSQVFATPGPPYRRMPGGILIESLDATRAWPAFFPVPAVWSAILAETGKLGGLSLVQAAPAFSPVFGALALWAFWLLGRAWLGAPMAAVAVVLLGASAPFFSTSRMPLSEPIAAYFVLAGLAVLAAAGSGRRSAAAQAGAVPPPPEPRDGAMLDPRDAALAGAALGAAVFTRIEIGLLLLMAVAVAPALGTRRASGAPAPASLRAFVAGALAVSAMTLVPALAIPGTWLSPLLDHLRNARIFFILSWGWPSLAMMAAAAGVAVAAALGTVRVIGWRWTLAAGVLAAVIVGHAAASNYLAERTPMWLSFSIGWSGLALAAVGAVLAFRERASLPAAAFVLALAVSAAVVLFYNPHVYPALPWGARRFVPILLPMLVLLGCVAASRAWHRNRLAGLVCVALLAWPVYGGGSPIWQRTLVEGAYEALQQLDAALPKDGTILIDREVSPMMVGPALWLVHDRIGISVPPTGSKAGNELLPPLVWYFAGKGPVYFVTRGAGAQNRTRNVKMKLLARVPVALPFLEQTYDRRPEKIQRYMMPLAIYRLDRSLDPKGGAVR